MRQTGQGVEGVVARGAPQTYASIGTEMNCSPSNVRKWMRRLIDQKYIRTERDQYGFRIFILNPKKVRVSKHRQSAQPQSVQTRTDRVSKYGRSAHVHHHRNKEVMSALLQNNLTKHLLNNKTAFETFPSSENQRQKIQKQAREIQKQAEKPHIISPPARKEFGDAYIRSILNGSTA